MSVKVRVSYERPDELKKVISLLRPVISAYKIKPAKGRYKLAYIELNHKRTTVEQRVNSEKLKINNKK